VYLTMLHFCRRDQNVCQNTSLACQYLESSFCPNSPTLHFGSFIMRAADFDTQRAARAKKFGLCSAAWATFFARIAAFTSWFRQGVACFLILFATASRCRSHTRREQDETTTQHMLYILEVFGSRTIRCPQSFFLHPCPPGPHTSFDRTS